MTEGVRTQRGLLSARFLLASEPQTSLQDAATPWRSGFTICSHSAGQSLLMAGTETKRWVRSEVL